MSEEDNNFSQKAANQSNVKINVTTSCEMEIL